MGPESVPQVQVDRVPERAAPSPIPSSAPTRVEPEASTAGAVDLQRQITSASASRLPSAVTTDSGRLRRSTSSTVAGDARDTETAPSRTQRLVVSPKLVVGSSNDPLEREADAMARDVMRSISIDAPEDAPTDVAIPATADASSAARSRVARSAVIGSAGGPVDGDTERAISAARGRGAPLDRRVRRSMERAFDADFSSVRVHVGAQSDALNSSIQARAFTTGSDIFIRSQDSNVSSAAGQELLAHELAHTVQQGAAPRIARRIGPRVQRMPSTTIQREKVELDQAQQAQYMDLGPGASDFAKRVQPATSASENGISYALSVLPRNPDGSLSPAAMQMIESFERENAWDSKYEKWMDEQLPAPARKKGIFGKESDRDYRKRIAAAARTLPGGEKNSITARSKNPEIANLTQSTGLPDVKVSEKTALSAVGVTLNYNQSDVNFGERASMIGQAFAKIAAAGGVLGSDLVFNLPKYGRTFTFSGDCKTILMSDFGTRAVFVAPNLVHLSSEILGNPNEKQMTGADQLHFLSSQLDPEGVASIVHELGHYCHYRNNASAFHSLNSATFKGREQSDLAADVSGYASGNPREFVAEVFLSLVYGRDVAPKAIAMYLGLGGMPVGAARTADVAPTDAPIN